MTQPALSVCICTHDRPEDVARCLAGLAAQTLAREQFEVLVIDSASPPAAARALRHVVAAFPGARLLREDTAGLSRARNAGAAAAAASWIAYLDDDAVPAPDWGAAAVAVLAESPSAGLLSGRVLPAWEAPLPRWWPARLRGVLSIVETEGQGPYGGPALPAGLEPCGANLLVALAALRAAGGFETAIGRQGRILLSDEETYLAARLRAAGWTLHYDGRLVVHHRILAARLTPAWLLERLYWQGVSSARTRRLLGRPVWREVPRRMAVALACAPAALLPPGRPWLLGARWRFAYALGFLREMFGGQGGVRHQRVRSAGPASRRGPTATVNARSAAG